MGKGRRARVLRFVRETRGDIQRYLLKRGLHSREELDALWLGKRGRLLPNGIYEMIRRRCRQAGIAWCIRTCSGTHSRTSTFGLAETKAT